MLNLAAGSDSYRAGAGRRPMSDRAGGRRRLNHSTLALTWVRKSERNPTPTLLQRRSVHGAVLTRAPKLRLGTANGRGCAARLAFALAIV